tara:strand:- start:1254 stop:1913 length:660 start_codon:yes stop_codon:yes gene_type:complete
MNASTELIPGMDMLIEHMRRQAECITDLKGIVDELKTENKMLKQEHNKFDEIWKTEGITQQDIIDMKRQISNQSDLIKKLKEEAEIREDWIHNVIRCLEVYDEWEGAGGDETADDLADRVATENKQLKAENQKLKEDLAVPELDEEDPLEYMVFELVPYFKDNEGNICADVGEGEEIGPVIGHFDDIVGKIIWNSKAAKNAHTRTSQQLLAKIKALATA